MSKNRSLKTVLRWARAAGWKNTRGSFHDFLMKNRAPRKHRRALLRHLQEFEKHTNPLMSKGLIQEQLVTFPRWARLALNLAREHDDPEKTIRSWARLDLFEGPQADVPNGTPLGRVIDEPQLISLFPETIPISRREKIVTLYSEPCKHVDPDQTFGRFALWATFSELDPDPFDFLDSSHDPVGDANELLALGYIPLPGEYWWFLTYNIDPDLKTRIPTIVEACAGNVWNEHFRPTTQDPPRYGWTSPPSGAPGRPEVVHLPIKFGDIKSHRKELAR